RHLLVDVARVKAAILDANINPATRGADYLRLAASRSSILSEAMARFRLPERRKGSSGAAAAPWLAISKWRSLGKRRLHNTSTS
ncbi:MAG: hypothetical protein ACR2OB_13970, partial [Solirubrobacteraceae bacterium]